MIIIFQNKSYSTGILPYKKVFTFQKAPSYIRFHTIQVFHQYAEFWSIPIEVNLEKSEHFG